MLGLGQVRPTLGTSECLGGPGRGREPHRTLAVLGPGSQSHFGPQLPASSWVTKEAEAGEVEEELAPGPRCHLSLLAAASLNLCPDTDVMGRKEGGAGAASCASLSSSWRVSGKDALGGRQGSPVTPLLRGRNKELLELEQAGASLVGSRAGEPMRSTRMVGGAEGRRGAAGPCRGHALGSWHIAHLQPHGAAPPGAPPGSGRVNGGAGGADKERFCA